MLSGPVLPIFVILSWDLSLLGFYLKLRIFEKLAIHAVVILPFCREVKSLIPWGYSSLSYWKSVVKLINHSNFL